MAIDYGATRIGLAVGDTETSLAAPVLGVAGSGNAETDARAVLAAAREYGAEEFVVGLPLNADDTEGPQAKITRAFGCALENAAGLPVHYQDERLSTAEAEEKMIPAELTRK